MQVIFPYDGYIPRERVDHVDRRFLSNEDSYLSLFVMKQAISEHLRKVGKVLPRTGGGSSVCSSPNSQVSLLILYKILFI